MISLQHLLWRLIVAGFAYVVAVLASIVVMIIGLGVFASRETGATASDAIDLFALVARFSREALLVPALATVVWPGWLIAGLLGEVTATRSLAVYLIAAAVIAVGGLVGTEPLVGLAHVQTTAAAGLVAGFVHWLLAGRSAGLLRRSASPVAVEGAPRPPHA